MKRFLAVLWTLFLSTIFISAVPTSPPKPMMRFEVSVHSYAEGTAELSAEQSQGHAFHVQMQRVVASEKPADTVLTRLKEPFVRMVDWLSVRARGPPTGVAYAQAQFIPKTPEDLGLPGAYSNMWRSQRALGLPAFQAALATPTITVSGSAPGGTTYVPAYDRTNVRVDPRFTYFSHSVIQAATTANDYDYVRSRYVPANPVSQSQVIVEWVSDASTIGIPFKRSIAGNMRLLVDGVEVFSYNNGISGKATAAAASTITLASPASTTAGFYNTWWIYIDGGTGVGQFAQITGYTTGRVATVSPAWTVQPDTTSTYIVCPNRSKWANAAGDGGGFGTISSGTLNYVTLTYSNKEFHRYRAEMFGWSFSGVNVPTNNIVMPVPSPHGVRMYYAGDSYHATGSALYSLAIPYVIANVMGWECCDLGLGGTGWLNTGGTLASLKVGDRLCPPVNSWLVSLTVGGTYTCTQGATSVNINTAVQTTIALVQTQFDSAFGAGTFTVAGSPTQLTIVGQGATGDIATAMSLTLGTATGTISAYTGELIPELLLDVAGKYRPGVIVIAMGHNDTAFSTASVTAEVTRVIRRLRQLYPNMTLLVVGNMYTNTTLTAVTDCNTAIYNGLVATGYKVNGRYPFVDSMSPVPWVVGSGNVGVPTANGIADFVNGQDGIHPSMAGHLFYGYRIANEFGKILYIQ